MALPAWVRAADVLTVVLLLAALAVALSGGGRLVVFGVRVSMTSWMRIALWAIAVTSIRHWFQPRPALPRTISKIVARLPRSDVFRAVFPALVVSRLALWVIALAAVYVFGYPAGEPRFRMSNDEALNLLARYDTGWYLDIADSGYHITSEFVQQNTAFFPLFPMIVGIVGRLVGENWLLAGFLVSMAAFAGALVYVYKLARLVCRGPDSAGLALALLAAYPFAVFYGAVYTEGLFLLCAAGTFSHALRREPVTAAALGLFAGLTRPNGLLLMAPLAVIVAVRLWPRLSRPGGWLAGPFWLSPSQGARVTVADLVMVAAPAIGVALYSAYLWTLAGEPLVWTRAQAAWGREYGGLISLIPEPFRSYGVFRALEASPQGTLNGLAGAFALALSWPTTRRYGLALGLFVALNVLVPVMNGGLISVGRFTSVLFPMFFYLADAVPARHRPYWVAVFAMGQALVASMFFTWRDIY